LLTELKFQRLTGAPGRLLDGAGLQTGISDDQVFVTDLLKKYVEGSC